MESYLGTLVSYFLPLSLYPSLIDLRIMSGLGCSHCNLFTHSMHRITRNRIELLKLPLNN